MCWRFVPYFAGILSGPLIGGILWLILSPPRGTAITLLPPPSPATTSASGTPASPFNPNTASASGLDRLPGIGPSRAQEIIDHRESQGAFGSIEDLLSVPRIGPPSWKPSGAWCSSTGSSAGCGFVLSRGERRV